MRSTLEGYLAWSAILAQIGTYFGLAGGVIGDPGYLLLAAGVGLVLAGWFCVASLTDREKIVGPAVDEFGRPIERSVLRRSGWARALSVATLLVAVLATIVVFAYRASAAFQLASASPPVMQWGGSALLESNESVPLSYTANLADLDEDEVREIVTIADGMLFTIAKRPLLSWVVVDDVRVVVESHAPKPPLTPLAYGTREPASIYLAEIAPPAADGDATFAAHYVPHPDETGAYPLGSSSGVTILKEDYPEPFVIKVLATTPGAYRYHVEVDLSYRGWKQTLTIGPRECIFIDADAHGQEDAEHQNEGAVDTGPV